MLSKHTQETIKRRKQPSASKKLAKSFSIIIWSVIILGILGTAIYSNGIKHSQQVCQNVYQLSENCR